VAGDDVFSAVNRFYDRLDGVREILMDPERTSVRLVVNPERMVIAEARRTYTYLSLFGYRVDAVVANRLLPDAIADPWFERWKELHTEHLQTIEEGFAPLPVLKVELAPTELVGLDALRGFGARVYGELDAASSLHAGQPLRITRRAGRTTLSLDLPFADRDDLELGRRGEELLVRVGPYRREIKLPDSLRNRPVVDASLRQGRLKVIFEGSADDR
jgi:arsenite-transporting ATPase